MTPDHLAELALIEASRIQRETLEKLKPEILKRDNIIRIGVKK